MTMELTIHEVANRLNLPWNTIERWVRQGRIPMQKSGNIYIMREAVMKKWAEAHNLSFFLSKKEIDQEKNLQPENLLPAMQRGSVLYGINGQTVEKVLKDAIDKIPDLLIKNKKELLATLIERESLASTGIGNGVAIPHPRTPLSEMHKNSAIITCFFEKPVDFGSIDNKPVFIMFILLSISVKTHLHLLSRLSFCVRNKLFIEFLKTSPAHDLFYAKIADYEKEIDQIGDF
ncbi:MAG: PTS sugar transporter subunit IIA [Deltaproteobacteria bacterium]|nr:PTS sugar transporter subunit IIA [Deltaproteobacteria bacterium]